AVHDRRDGHLQVASQGPQGVLSVDQRSQTGAVNRFDVVDVDHDVHAFQRMQKVLDPIGLIATEILRRVSDDAITEGLGRQIHTVSAAKALSTYCNTSRGLNGLAMTRSTFQRSRSSSACNS